MNTDILNEPGAALGMFQSSKGDRMNFASRLVLQIEEGYVDPLTAHLQVKCMEDLLDIVKANPTYKNLVLEEAQKHGSKSFEFHNAKFTIGEYGTKWDYSKCEDQVIVDMLAEKARLDDAIKARQKMLQSIPASGMADPATGTLIYPAAKSSTTAVSVTLK